jgi:pantoate--beta-alanine ligase
MGALHAGHMALVAAARRAHQAVSVSIFVNPKQFGPSEDLARYPRPIEHDLDLLRAAGVDAVLTPSSQEIYPTDFATTVDIHGPLTERLEGVARPGHFTGVTTVVAKLLNLARPRVAYFGQKDAQQALVVRQLVRDLNLGCAIAVVPTVREPDGLALSSRNVYLNQEERRAATALYQALKEVARAYAQGERQGATLRSIATRTLEAQPLIQIDYVSVCSTRDLSEVEAAGDGTLVALAARVGGTRLIDNVLLGNATL